MQQISHLEDPQLPFVPRRFRNVGPTPGLHGGLLQLPSVLQYHSSLPGSLPGSIRVRLRDCNPGRIFNQADFGIVHVQPNSQVVVPGYQREAGNVDAVRVLARICSEDLTAGALNRAGLSAESAAAHG